MAVTSNSTFINDLCLISRHGVCLMDMRKVVEKAQQLGLRQVAELVENDLQTNKITNGAYYPIVAGLYGAQP